MKIKRFIFCSFSLAFFCFLFLSATAHAAALFFDAGKASFVVGQESRVDVLIDAGELNTNAFEGTITFPKSVLDVRRLDDSDSVINFWAKPLSVSTEGTDGTISWSGIAPGGFQGVLGPYSGTRPGRLFSIIFVPKTVGAGALVFKDVSVLQNDGEGTPAPVSLAPFMFSVVATGSAFVSLPTEKDLNPPEDFTVSVAHDADMFDGKYFIVFSAVDNESGIDHYEILETRDAGNVSASAFWKRGESPYVLSDQTLRNFVYVKAIDRAGNERVENIPPEHPTLFSGQFQYVFWSIIVLGIAMAFVLFVWKKTKGKK